MGNAFSQAKDFLHTPFTEEMDALHLFLVVGLVLVMAAAWGRILAYLVKLEGEVAS